MTVTKNLVSQQQARELLWNVWGDQLVVYSFYGTYIILFADVTLKSGDIIMQKDKEGKPLANCDPKNKAKTSSVSSW